MASALIHVAVAKKVNDYLKLPEYDYYLGSIAPDLAKQIGLSKKQGHFIDDDTSIPNILRFLDKYYHFINKPFEMGYFIHLYTDKIWYENFWTQISLENNEVKLLNGNIKKLSKDRLFEMAYSDYSSLNKHLIEKYNLDLYMFYNEVILPKSSIKELNIKDLHLLLERMGVLFLEEGTKEKYLFDEDMVDKFIDDASQEIINFIKKLKK